MFRRSLRAAAVVAIIAVAAAAPGSGAAQEQGPLTIVSWGGGYTASQMRAYINPFRDTTDRWVQVEDYAGGLEEVRRQVESLNVTWDVIDLNLSDAIRGCQQGLLEPIDAAILPDAPDGTPAAEDFLPGTIRDCAIGQNVFSTVVAYDETRLPQAPDSIADFFDVQRFPGNRGVRANPRVVLEWALLADGVPAEEVYEVLATEEGLDRAFEVMDPLRGHIVWWQGAQEPIDLLERGRVVMTQSYNGRITEAIEDGAPYGILWDGQVRDIELWGIPRGTRDKDDALDFIAFASQPERMAEQSRHIAYGPVRESALAMLEEPLRQRLPTAEGHSAHALWSNEDWWAENQDRVNLRLDDWRQRGPLATPLKGTAR